MTSSPFFQLTGVATEYLAVSCKESMTRKTSSKLRPVDAGYSILSFTFLSGPMTNTERTVRVLSALGWIISYFLAISPVVSAISGKLSVAPWVSRMSAAQAA